MYQSNGIKEFFVISFTFLCALVLTAIPLPTSVEWWRPAWMMLTVLFWLIIIPRRVGIVISWFVGLLVDLLVGGPIGVHALVFTLMAFLVSRFHLFVRGLSTLHKLLFVAVLQTVLLLLQYFTLSQQHAFHTNWQYWIPILSTSLCWVLLKGLLKKIQLRYKIG